MADPILSMNFDSASLERIQRLRNFEKYLEPEMQAAMEYVVDILQGESQTYMWTNFVNPTGPLEDSVEKEVISPYEGQVYTDSPYAWRREEGFDGADSLGRVYNDQGIHFFAETLRMNKPLIEIEFEDVVQEALYRMGE